MKNRFSLQITGESGQGINSLGDIISKTLKDNNYYLFGYREYPSLIKGGVAGYQVTFGPDRINSPSSRNDFMISMSRASFHEYLPRMKKGGIVMYSFGKPILAKEEKEFISERELKLFECTAEDISIDITSTKRFTNTAVMGFITKIFALDKAISKDILLERYGKDNESRDQNEKVFEDSYNKERLLSQFSVSPSNKNLKDHLNINGNQATALGIINAGCRAYYHYPMTPVTSISSMLERSSVETGVFVFQTDDEIAAAQMALGSYYAGTRALTATSGGGFDLMSESLSMAGMTEIPFVVILGQRPGPSTGLPTWSSDSDLNVALYSGHGEFPRIVISASEPRDSFELIQKAFTLSEKYQLPVVLLTDKHIGESLFVVEKFEDQTTPGIPHKTDLIGPRYAYSENAVSNRTLPGSSENLTITNSDEHDIFGNSTESSETTIDMQDRRELKLDLVKEDLPDNPILFDHNNKNLIVSWGAPRGAILDALSSELILRDREFSFLQLNYIWPLPQSSIDLLTSAENVIFIEQNKTGQLETLLTKYTHASDTFHLRKYDGRPFFPDEIINYLNSLDLKR